MATDFDRLVGRNLRVLRTVAGLSQAELARNIEARGVQMVQQTVAKIETGQRSLRLHEAVATAEVLGVTIAQLARQSTVVVTTRSTSWNVHEEPDRAAQLEAELQEIVAKYRSDIEALTQPSLLDVEQRHAS